MYDKTARLNHVFFFSGDQSSMLSLIDLVAAKEEQKSQGKLKRRVSRTFHNFNLVK